MKSFGCHIEEEPIVEGEEPVIEPEEEHVIQVEKVPNTNVVKI